VDDELWCPRRAEAPNRVPGPDRWRNTPALVDASAAAGPTCSYCGSLEPGRFLDLIEAGWLLEATAKDYKAYLHRRLSEQEIAQRQQDWLAGTVAQAVRRVEEAAGKTPDEIDLLLARRWEKERGDWAATCAEAKMYYQHLSVEQKRRFIELFNNRTMQFTRLGRFTVDPYFCVAQPPDE
jgi:hypothetical protein